MTTFLIDRRRLKVIRKRAQENIPDATQLVIKVSDKVAKQVTRYLNDSIGMSNYEIASSYITTGGMIEAELWVPGRDLALLLKLKFGGL